MSTSWYCCRKNEYKLILVVSLRIVWKPIRRAIVIRGRCFPLFFSPSFQPYFVLAQLLRRSYLFLSFSLSRPSQFPDTDLSNFQITLPSARLRPTEGRLQIVRTSTLSRRRISPLHTRAHSHLSNNVHTPIRTHKSAIFTCT